jgi:hypothetical protein
MLSRLVEAIAILIAVATQTGASTIYQNGAPDHNYVPFGPSGTPGKPSPGNLLGNQITFGGTDRFLDLLQVEIGEGANAPPQALTDSFTVTLYENDAPGGAPGTILATSSVFTTIGPNNFMLDFPFAIAVPDTLTVAVGEANPTVHLGLVSTSQPPVIGSALNGLWFNTNSAATSWVFNTTWAVADGATTNVFVMTAIAAPEPASFMMAGLGLALIALRKRK